MEIEFRVLSHAEQTARGIDRPEANCPACTYSFRIRPSNRLYLHGPPGNRCRGSDEVASGLTLEGA